MSDKPVQAKPGEWVYIRIAPQPKPEAENPRTTGSARCTGGCYIFLFPFDLWIRDDLDGVATTQIGSTLVTCHVPHSNESAGGYLVRQAAMDRVPFRSGTIPPSENAPVLESLEFNRKGYRHADALRMDFEPDQEAAFAKEVADNFLVLARWATRQWWITRDRRHTEDNLRNWFPINEHGERLEGVHSFGKQFANFGFEHPLTEEMFQQIVADLGKNHGPPIYAELMLDGSFHLAAGDHVRALLDLATAAETAVATFYRKAAPRYGKTASQVKRILAQSFPYAIGPGASRLFRTSFARSHSDAYSWIRQLRVARGQVAHGQSATVREKGGVRAVIHSDVHQMLLATVDLTNWLVTL